VTNLKRSEKNTTLWVSNEAHQILQKWAKIHDRTICGMLENLAFLITCGIDDISNPNMTIPELKKLYSQSQLVVFADIRNLFEVDKKRE